MKLLQMEITQKQIPQKQIPTTTRPALSRWLALAADRLKLVWRSVIWRSISWVRRSGSKRKTLAVRETAALGDRRFVSVVQFERQRFLIGSGPSSVTLLAQLPDESASGEQSGEKL